MANEEHLELLSHGVEVWNSWRIKNTQEIPNLNGAFLSGAYLKEANLAGADLSEANFSEADLSLADLRGAFIENADFSGANLLKADLRGADLRKSDLFEADLTEVNLTGANLSEVDFVGAVLNRANLKKAYLARAFLGGANFSETDLSLADLSGTHLDRTKFDMTIFSGTHFISLDLSSAEGLDKCIHDDPSVINNETLRKSSLLPTIFLKGIGLADWEIEQTKLYNPNITRNEFNDILIRVENLRFENPLQAHNLFISYAHKDRAFVDKLEPYLDKRGIRYWRDTHDLAEEPQGPLEKILVRAMSDRTILLVLSENSVKSEWVRFEMESAYQIKIKEGRESLCPIRLDSAVFEHDLGSERLKRRLYEHNITEFEDWETDNDKFEKRVGQLIQGLDLFYKPKMG